MKSRINWHFKEIQTNLLEVVADATINNVHTAQGKTIPLVILDTSKKPDVDKAIELHTSGISGNVITQWGKSKDENYLYLTVKLLDPLPLDFTIMFCAHPQSAIVDLIISSQMLYIQGGKHGDRLKHDINKPKILIEVPSENFAIPWKVLYLKILAKNFEKKGYSKKESKKLALNFYNEMRIVKEMRIK